MSFTSDDLGGPQAEDRRIVGDPRALRALAHPLRLAILDHLMTFGPQTASQCARVVGSTASNCSYHLRSLAHFGLVESMDAADGRERPWRSAATGFQFGTEGSGPADSAASMAERVLAHNRIDTSARLAHRSLDAEHTLSQEWREAMGSATYALKLTAAELQALGDKLDALIRPYIALTRADPPEGSGVVHLALDAFPHPDAEMETS
jgi:hypothetical protein